VCVLWAPAAALASNAAISFGPVKAGHGYTLSGTAGTPSPGAASELTLVLSKKGGSQTQSYSYEYSKQVSVKANGNLSSGTLKVTVGSYGKLSLRFAATGGSKTIKDPDGCTGPKFQARPGKVNGTLSFKTHSSFLGNVSAHTAKASLTKFGPGTEHCGASVDTYLLTISGGGTLSGNLLGGTRHGSTNSVSAGYNQFASGTFPFILFASITQGGSSAWSFQPNLSSARVSVSGPFMSGTSAFAETSRCETTPNFVYGSVSGTVTAHFDVGGTQTYGSDGQGTLTKDLAQCGVGCGASCGTGGTTPLAVTPSCGQDDPTDPTIGCSDNTSGGTPPYTYSWDFGDGSPADTDATPTHTYAAAGTYTVSETVTDATGKQQTGETQITVTSS
jgi:PKD repeat protein